MQVGRQRWRRPRQRRPGSRGVPPSPAGVSWFIFGLLSVTTATPSATSILAAMSFLRALNTDTLLLPASAGLKQCGSQKSRQAPGCALLGFLRTPPTPTLNTRPGACGMRTSFFRLGAAPVRAVWSTCAALLTSVFSSNWPPVVWLRRNAWRLHARAALDRDSSGCSRRGCRSSRQSMLTHPLQLELRCYTIQACSKQLARLRAPAAVCLLAAKAAGGATCPGRPSRRWAPQPMQMRLLFPQPATGGWQALSRCNSSRARPRGARG